jgi:hypothetical protein
MTMNIWTRHVGVGHLRARLVMVRHVRSRLVMVRHVIIMHTWQGKA